MEKALVVALDLGNDTEFLYDLEELKRLCEACDMEVADTVIQRSDSMNKALFIGTGKVQEVKERAALFGAEIVVFNDSLSPMQVRNLQNEIELPVLDRTTLILDIFSKRAKTREAKVQVETARLQYLLPRLAGRPYQDKVVAVAPVLAIRVPENKRRSLTEDILKTVFINCERNWMKWHMISKFRERKGTLQGSLRYL